MQEFALITLLAQPSQPMLADEIVERMSSLVLVGTGDAKRAVPFSKRLAIRTTRIEAEAIFPSEKIGEGEVVLRRSGME